MKLISSRETLNFLSQAAPRPWVQRMLRWMAFDEGLSAYSRKGKIQAHGPIYQFTAQLLDNVKQTHGPEMDAAIREEYSEEIAAKLIGKEPMDHFYDEPFTWDETEEPRLLESGLFLFTDEIDWDAGTIKADYIPGYGELQETFFGESEAFGTELERPDFDVEIEGLSFEFSKIEMLLPSMELGQSIGFTASQHDRRRPVGRPQKWDWEGAMAFVISRAQHPDGLPTGHGAQARIEAMIAEWFVDQVDESPSPSQVRIRAAKIMQMIEMPKNN